MIHHISKSAIAVQVPEGKKYLIADDGILYSHTGSGEAVTANKVCDLPSGSWEIVGIASSLTEKIAHDIVDKELKSVGWVYLDYMQPETVKRPYKFDDALPSLQSFCKGIGVDPNNILIIKKK